MFSKGQKSPHSICHTPLTQNPYTNQCVGERESMAMRATPKAPSYLVRNPYSYCFRMVALKDLQTIVGKTELRYSLRIGSAGIARKKAQHIAGMENLLFTRLRNGRTNLKKLTNDHIKALVDQYIKESINS